MMKRIIVILFIGALSGWLSCNLMVKKPVDRITFSHALHIKNGLECSVCHIRVGDNFSLPTMSTCAQCHDETKDTAKCNMCHTYPEHAKSFVFEKIQGLNFSHSTHLSRVKNDCYVCHKTIKKANTISVNILPDMIACVKCHSNDVRENKCILCHGNLGSPDFKPYAHLSHEGDFLKEHQNLAMTNSSQCYQCHKQGFCSDCHSKVETLKPSEKYPEKVKSTLIHRGDWITRHPMEASVNPEKCLKCHSIDYCQRCHAKRGAIPSTTIYGGHPSGWLDPASPDFHGNAARRNALLCASCHEQGNNTICLKCHTTQH